MKISEILTEEEMKIMNQKENILGIPDREFLKQYIGQHYKELELKELLLWEITMELFNINFTNTIPEKIKEEKWQ